MIDLFPDMPLEIRAYLLLALIGSIFFIAIIVLAVGNVRNNIQRAKEYDSTDLHMTQEKQKPAKEKRPKKEKAPKKEKKPLFGKKKTEAVDVLAVPAGYEPEEEEIDESDEEVVFAPTGVGEVIEDDLPDDWLTTPSEPSRETTSPFGVTQDFDEAHEDYNDDLASDGDDFTTSPSEEKKQNPNSGSSPFGGGVGLDI